MISGIYKNNTVDIGIKRVISSDRPMFGPSSQKNVREKSIDIEEKSEAHACGRPLAAP